MAALGLLWAALTQDVWVAVGLATLAVLGAGGALLSVRGDRARRSRDLMLFHGGSVDAAAATLDRAAIRTIRDTRGEIHAVREVRRALPMLSLEQSVEVVRSL